MEYVENCGKLPVEQKQTATYSYYHAFASHWPGCWVPSRPPATANSESQSLFFLCRALFQINIPCQVPWRVTLAKGQVWSRSGAVEGGRSIDDFLGKMENLELFWIQLTAVFNNPIGSMVLPYMVLHGSHQYTPFMLAYQHHGSVMAIVEGQFIELFCRPKLMCHGQNHGLVSHIWGWFRIPMMGWMTKKTKKT